jgi:virginiamycin B lyase
MKSLFRLAWSGLLLLVVSVPAMASKAALRSFPIPTANSGPTSVIAAGIGALFTEFDANKIGFRTRDGRMLEFTIPTPNSGPMDLDITCDSTGRCFVWFTEFLANKIGRLNPHTGEFREFAIPTAGSGPHSIVVVPSPIQELATHQIWFTEFYGNKIGRMTGEGVFTEFEVPTAGSGPMGITSARSPDTITFTELLGNKIGRLPLGGGLGGGTIEELPIPTPDSGPTDIQWAADGRLFFTEFNAGKIGHIAYDHRTIVETALPTSESGPYRICKSPYANREVWFTERSANRIGVIRRDGLSITEYDLPSGHTEPLGCAYGGAQVWFAQRTPNALGWIHHDASVVLGGTALTGWQTSFSYANASPDLIGVYASGTREPFTICGICPWWRGAALPPYGTAAITVPSSLVFTRSLERAELATLEARVRYLPQAQRATNVPAVRLSTISELAAGVLVFPGATRTATSRSNLILSELLQDIPFQEVHIEVRSSAGDLLGSEEITTAGGFFVDYLDRLGIRELTNGQVRVTTTGDAALLWGSLTTVDGDALLSDVGRNLSRSDLDFPGGDSLVVLGGVVGTWDTDLDIGNARAEALSGTIGPVGCAGGSLCPGAPVFAFSIPANGTRTFRASEVPGLPGGFAAYGIRFGGSGVEPTVRARVVNRARPSQTALLPALHLSAIRKLDATALSFPGAAHSATGARSNLVLTETGVGDAAVLVEVFAPSGTVLKSIPLHLARGQTTFLADVVRDAGGDVENAHVLVTRAGREGSIWAILSTFDDAQALSVGWGIAP